MSRETRSFNGEGGSTGDGGLATKAELAWPVGLVVEHAGDVFIADSNNAVVREVHADSGVITMQAGH